MKEFFKISLAGDLGSGKSTVGAILKDRFTKDFLNGKKLYKNMFENLSFENNQSEVAVFSQNPENSQKVFLGVISQNLRYSYVVHNVF